MALAIVTHPSLLPFLTTLIGTGGFTVGLYSFVDPSAAARIYGVPIYSQGDYPSPSAILATGRAPKEATANTELSAENLSLIHALGIRNLTAGLSILSLTGYHHFFLAEGFASHAVRIAVQRALGIVVLVGALVPITDAWICLQRSRDVYISRLAADRQEGKTVGGARSIWDNHELEHKANVTGKKAGVLHAARSLIWLLGGLWCLFG